MKKGFFQGRTRTVSPVGMEEALGQSEPFLAFQERLSRVAPVNRPVLLIGERGTGKELAASRLHFLSSRWQGPLIALNCAALSPSLIESELFGYEKGAFTGAQQQSRGRFEAADGGTLFLDEIGSIPIEVQRKILRVVEYNSFERVGSSQTIEVDVRIIAATNEDLQELTRQGRFKGDLLDRISFEVLLLPPLRRRGEDVILLAGHFAARMAMELGREALPVFSEAALDSLRAYPWPGNVRELKNVVERAVYRSDTPEISHVEFDPFSSPYASEPPAAEKKEVSSEANRSLLQMPVDKPIGAALKELKLQMIRKALADARYNQKSAAERLGLTYHQFRGLYRRYKEEIS